MPQSATVCHCPHPLVGHLAAPPTHPILQSMFPPPLPSCIPNMRAAITITQDTMDTTTTVVAITMNTINILASPVSRHLSSEEEFDIKLILTLYCNHQYPSRPCCNKGSNSANS